MPDPPGRGVLPYMGYIDMCGPKGYGFSAVLVIIRVCACTLVINSVLLEEATSSSCPPSPSRALPYLYPV